MGTPTVAPPPPSQPQKPPHLEDYKWKLSKKETAMRSRHRRCAFTRKCAALVKEQRARFYIMRRCITMLICWRDYNDS